MALTNGRAAVTQLTATGQSGTLTRTGKAGGVGGIRNVTGTGTITVGATATVQWRATGGTIWFNLVTFTFGLVASTTESRTVDLPPGPEEWSVAYTAPSGSTGHMLDFEIADVEPD